MEKTFDFLKCNVGNDYQFDPQDSDQLKSKAFFESWFCLEKNEGQQSEKGEENQPGINHIAEERRHFETSFFGNGFNHKIRSIPDIR